MSETVTPRPESAQLDCPECRTSITYYDVAGSEFYACPNCHAYFQHTNEETPKLIGKYTRTTHATPLIPLGALGTLAGTQWRVVGFVERCEYQAQQYTWSEYQLYQPETREYAQLAQFNGHWIIIRPFAEQKNQIKLVGQSLERPEGTYRLYARYQTRILWAVGEFDWDIKGDDSVKISEYILPPRMVVQERNENAVTWYRAEHVEPSDVAAGFKVPPSSLPTPEGVGAVEPNPSAPKWPALKRLTLVALALLLLGQVLFSIRHRRETLLSERLRVVADTAAAAGTGRIIVSPSFTLKDQAALLIELNTTLNNQWLELPVSLVNEQTGQGFEFTKNIEYYSGVEGGENWTEGRRDTDAVLSRVPAGRYHLNFYPITEAGPAAPEIVVTVVANPFLWSNFFIALLSLLIYPVWLYMRRASHETGRWSQSDYGPTQ
ncbi:hypothetical protein GCM10022409_44850 [Hymenobacter glaciei]|uniref:DUF4178 domain-containing protein n=1 Tax=Hymenobacter glaciei TaxID=877209 RepID=A0ABP7UU20_9BACT